MVEIRYRLSCFCMKIHISYHFWTRNTITLNISKYVVQIVFLLVITAPLLVSCCSDPHNTTHMQYLRHIFKQSCSKMAQCKQCILRMKYINRKADEGRSMLQILVWSKKDQNRKYGQLTFLIQTSWIKKYLVIYKKQFK